MHTRWVPRFTSTTPHTRTLRCTQTSPYTTSGSTAMDSQRAIYAHSVAASARSQRRIHQTRLFKSFQSICGSPRGAPESKRHGDTAAVARANSDQRRRVVDDNLSREIEEIWARTALWHVKAPNSAASGGHCAANGDSPPLGGPAAPPGRLTRQRGQPQTCCRALYTVSEHDAPRRSYPTVQIQLYTMVFVARYEHGCKSRKTRWACHWACAHNR